MIMLTKQISVNKSVDEVKRIISSCSCFFPKPVFSEDSFTVYLAKRYNGGTISHIRLSGTVHHNHHFTEVTLDIHWNISFIFGIAACLLGILELIYCLILQLAGWIAVAGCILFGVFLCAYSRWEASILLDRVIRKLMD